MNTLDLVGFVLNRKKSELDLTQDILFLGIRLRMDLGEASLPESKTREIVARARHLSSLRVLTFSQVSQLMGSLNWASGLIPLDRLYLRPLQRHFYSLGLTNQFTQLRRSYPLVLAILLRHWQDLRYLTSGFPDFGYLDPYRPQAPHQLFGVQGGSLCPAALGSNAPGPPGTWTRTDRKIHINCTELKAVVSALQH